MTLDDAALEGLLDKVPPQARDSIQKAIDKQSETVHKPTTVPDKAETDQDPDRPTHPEAEPGRRAQSHAARQASGSSGRRSGQWQPEPEGQTLTLP
ncbi:MAG: hypothetical protein M3067_07365 [Chloroflexota bacterium]|nr:hypothetical protein [Chloroflexota bacterium]